MGYSKMRKAELIEKIEALQGRIAELEHAQAERKRAEEALRDSRHMLQTVLDSIPAAVFWKDRDSIYLGGNRTWLEAAGLKSSEVVGKSDYDLPWEKKQTDSFREDDRRVMESGIPEYDIIEPYLRADGTHAWARTNKVPLRDTEGNVVGVLGTYEDITERKQAEEELREHREHLEELVEERTAELEAFTYSVSHDLRAPLRAMEGFSQALLEDYADRLDPVGQDYAQRIAAAAQHMDILIQDLLAYSRLNRIEIKLRLVVLEGVVQEALSLLTTEIQEKGAQVAVERPLPRLVGHRATLVQVVGNLLSNAIKFVAPGVKPQVRVCAEECEEWVRLWVEDNGIGIAPEHHELIFRIFERLHGVEAYPGTGVGLAIVRKGVERLGGRVGVESEPGRGSRFWVELPRSKT